MKVSDQASTGLPGLDGVIDMLQLGDNVVWQVGSLPDYKSVVDPFVAQTKKDGYRLVYMRFGLHQSILDDSKVDRVYYLNPDGGFESFATKVHQIIEEEGEEVFYVFDCLSDLLEYWYSDLMIGNFFRVTCPFLFSLKTVSYFALIEGTHTNNTIARIRETTQLLLDLHYANGKTYVHPLKVSERYSPAMFFPHLIQEAEAISITASSEAAMLFSGRWRTQQPRDYWEITLEGARRALAGGMREQEQAKSLLISLIIGREAEIVNLAQRYFSLADLLKIASREIGTGFIGGKSVGFLLARRILEEDACPELQALIEPHDSFYIGSDVFYTYIVQNELWNTRMSQKTPEGYFSYGEELREKMLRGVFPETVREQFEQMLEYFGQSPIIVRSSSLQEDGYGNAFAGKYESVFCANQGSPEERYEAFEQALRVVYASVMNDDALLYRKERGLMEEDEQMAVLVQRVSGDHYGDLFFPHIGGVANSVNFYLWEPDMDPHAGMMRLVFGLGTRAVDRVSGDYARIAALDRPDSAPLVSYGEEARFSQHYADVLNLRNNSLESIALLEMDLQNIGTDKQLFFSPDQVFIARMREAGRDILRTPHIADFRILLGQTGFPRMIQELLSRLEQAYRYPVDVEFAANFNNSGEPRINIVQCRPLQTRGLETVSESPAPRSDQILFQASGNFMGGNLYSQIDYVISINPEEYLVLAEQERYLVARLVGSLNQELKEKKVLLVGPGRWGTTTSSLGVPVHFTELSHMLGICEVAYEDMTPELSFGSHFFQDLVESNIVYVALYNDESTLYNPAVLDACKVYDREVAEDYRAIKQAVRVVETPGLCLYLDVSTQLALCCFTSS